MIPRPATLHPSDSLQHADDAYLRYEPHCRGSEVFNTARLGTARHGEAWLGRARKGKARQGVLHEPDY
jgi:hypothetical protein